MASPIGQAELLTTVGRRLELLLRLEVAKLRGERTQREMIELLADMGFASAEIASALASTPANVDPVLSRYRNAKKGPKKAKANSRGRKK